MVMGMDILWMKEAGLDTETGIGYTGGEEKYVAAVQRFYRNYEKNREKVEEAFNSKDYESLMITVHALKSNAKMIGADTLSGCFESLEAAAGSKDTDVIMSLTPVVMRDYKILIEKLSPVSKLGEVHAADEISAQEAVETVGQLLDALDDFDDDLAKQLATKLSGYPFRMTQADKLKEAIAFIDDFMYEEAAQLIREIGPAIE